MWIDRSTLPARAVVVRRRSPRATTASICWSRPGDGPPAAAIVGGRRRNPAGPDSIPLADVAGQFLNRELDGRGNHLLVMRTPGDLLRIRPERDSLVFATGETMKFLVEPQGLPPAEGGKPQIKVQLLGAGESWSRQAEVPGDGAAALPVAIPLPEDEGVYDVAIAAVANASWSQAVRQPLSWKRTLAQRRVQIVVLQTRRPPPGPAETAWKEVAEIDPASPRWYEKLGRLSEARLAKAHLPRLWKSPLGNDCLRPRRHVLGELAELRPDADAPDVSWQAFWLPISQPGRPHLLEVDYPSDVAQTLGIAIVEPNAAGVMTPMTIGSGVNNAAEPVGGDPRWRQHRLIFWPGTNSPLVLLTNARQARGAVRQAAGLLRRRAAAGGPRRPAGTAVCWRPISTAPCSPSTSPRRGLGPLERPLPRQLADVLRSRHPAGRLSQPRGLQRADDRRGGRRQRDLSQRGVGAHAALRQRRIFLHRPGPGPQGRAGDALAAVRPRGLALDSDGRVCHAAARARGRGRAGGPEAEGLAWIGADGTPGGVSGAPRRGLAPYYNLLHPRVQEAMLHVLRELVCALRRPPFVCRLGRAALGRRLCPVARPGLGARRRHHGPLRPRHQSAAARRGPDRFAERAAFSPREPQRGAWLAWRADQLCRFYRRACDELTSVRPDGRLYLAGADMFGGQNATPNCGPPCRGVPPWPRPCCSVGIDAQRLRDVSQRLVLLRPDASFPVPTSALRRRPGNGPDGRRRPLFSDPRRAGQPVLPSAARVAVASFDEQNPFKPSYLWLVSQTVPAANRNRRRFVHSLATLDSQVIVDGGWTLPMGEEDSVRNLIAASRALPAVGFRTVAGQLSPPVGDQASAPVGDQASGPAGDQAPLPARDADPPGAGAATGETSQPVTFRWATYDGSEYLYAVNDAPFATTAQIHIDASPACQLEELSGGRTVAPLRAEGKGGFSWEVELEPYDLAAVRLSETGATFSHPQTTWSGAVEADLAAQIRRLGAAPPPCATRRRWTWWPIRASRARRPGPGEIPDWTITGFGGGSVELDRTEKHGGQQSVKMATPARWSRC